MKKIYTILIFLVAISVFYNGNAQAPYIKIETMVSDTGSMQCKPPYIQNVGVYLKDFYGVGTGSKIYFWFKVDYGDGYIDSFRGVVTFPTSAGTFYLGHDFRHGYSSTGTYSIVVSAREETSSVVETVRLAPFSFTDSCTTFTGKLYKDVNKNCIADPGELGFNWIPVRAINTITGDTSYAKTWTDTSGFYEFKMPAGTYMLTPMVESISGVAPAAHDTIASFCPSSGSTIVSVLPLSTYRKDFAYECKVNDSFDAAVNLYSNCFRPGDTSLFFINSVDWKSRVHAGCTGRDATVIVDLDPALTYIGVYKGTTPSSISGSALTYNLVDADLSGFFSTIIVALDTATKLGALICSGANITPAAGFPDPDLSNNDYTYCRTALSAYDPNMKEVSPKGKGEEAYIAQNTALTYTIHFQNTGTAAANNVRIVDTLDKSLDEKSLHILSSTHNVVLQQTDKIVQFNFKNIYLPDSSSDYYGSMGSVTYAILPKRDLAPGTEIKNRAGIYFDYNDPIITNYTLNTIEIPTTIKNVRKGDLVAQIFPNPAHTVLNIKMENNSDFSVQIMDMLGRTVVGQNTNNGIMAIPTQSLPSGMYLLNIRDAKGNELNTKVVVKH